MWKIAVSALVLVFLIGGGCGRKGSASKSMSVSGDAQVSTSGDVTPPALGSDNQVSVPGEGQVSGNQGVVGGVVGSSDQTGVSVNAGASANVNTKVGVTVPSPAPVPKPTPAPAPTPKPAPVIAPSINVVINGKQLTEAQLQEFERRYGQKPAEGKYWYDSRSGFYGFAGGPTAGVMNAGHSYGAVSANASNGNSGVFINGRQLQTGEALGLAALFGSAPPGRYWMDSNGNIGVEGTDFPVANLYVALAAAAQSGGGGGGGGGGGDNFWSSRFSAGNYNSQGQGYVSVPGYGPVGYGF